MKSNTAKQQKSKRPLITRETWIFIALYLLLSVFLFDPKLFTGGDNAVYIALGESIASGKGYRNIYLPEEPAHAQYPFGFPLLMAPFILFFGKNIMILKIVVLLCGIGALFFACRIFGTLFKERMRLITAFYLSIPILTVYNHWILSEIPFLFFSLGAIYFATRFHMQRDRLSFFLASFFSIYAFFIRTAGFSLILAFFLSLVVKKQLKDCLAFSGLCIACIAPWLIRNARVPDNAGYIAQLMAKNPYNMDAGKAGIADLVERVWQNAVFYTGTVIPQILIPAIKSAWLSTAAGLTFLALAAAGFLRRVRELTFLEIYAVLGVVVLLAWPRVWSSDRFFLPILPVFLIYLFIALLWIGTRVKSRHFLAVLVSVVVAANLFQIYAESKTAVANNISYAKGDKYAGYTPDWRRYFELIEWIRKNIPQGMVIMARKPEFVFLGSGRKSFCYPFSDDTEKVKDAIAASDYIILDNFYWTGTTGRYLYPVVKDNLQDYELVHATRAPEFYLLRTKKYR
jgi:hypothetical protein